MQRFPAPRNSGPDAGISKLSLAYKRLLTDDKWQTCSKLNPSGWFCPTPLAQENAANGSCKDFLLYLSLGTRRLDEDR